MHSELELSIIAPCFNEEHNVSKLTARVLATLEHGKLRGELVLAAGWRTGTNAARGDAVCALDADRSQLEFRWAATLRPQESGGGAS
jgi:hypothetical protein